MNKQKTKRIDNNINNINQQLFAGEQHTQRQGDDRITFGTMDIERRERIDNNINVRVERSFEPLSREPEYIRGNKQTKNETN